MAITTKIRTTSEETAGTSRWAGSDLFVAFDQGFGSGTARAVASGPSADDAAAAIVVAAPEAPAYTLQLLHFSDAEAGLLASNTAKYLAALVDAFEGEYANSITLASGDLFLPGPFLAGGTDPSLATLVPGNSNPGRIDISIMNAIGIELSAIGNHEFDLGSNVLSSAITAGSGYAGALFPYLSANLDFTGDSALFGRYVETVGVNGLEEATALRGRITPSTVITENGERIGFVGATTQVLEQISSPSGTEVKGFPTGPGANGEVNDMVLLAAQLQPVIDDLIAQGVNKIIVVSHLQQLALEKALAPLLHGVDVIVAGGSHTRLGDDNDVAVDFPGSEGSFEDTYPLVTENADGNTTVIVNTGSEYTYLGRLLIDFDADGNVIAENIPGNSGVSGAYASTAENVADAWGVEVEDLDDTALAEGTRGDAVQDLTDAVQAVIEAKDGNIFGYSEVYLEGERIQVRNQETNLGNLSADANGDAARRALGLTEDHAVVSIKNGGGIRAQIGTIVNNPDGTVTKVAPEVDGEVSQLDTENALRFDNKLMVFDTNAQGLLNILNSPNALAPNNGGFVQIGGVRFSYDPTRAAGSRVQDIVLINEHGQITAVIADDGVANPDAPSVISVAILNFTAQGGDGYLIKPNGENFRYLLNDGTVSAAIDESLDFTLPANVPANALGEIEAFARYMRSEHGTREEAYDVADTAQQFDTRIQNQSVRGDTVLEGEYLVLGSALAERLDGSDRSETIKGLAGDDALIGGAGNDRLNGGEGADLLDGGTGIDTATYADATLGITASLALGGLTNEAAGDEFVRVENLVGSRFDDVLSGNNQNNVLDGGDGNDLLDGGRGLDTLIGGAGDDLLRGSGGVRGTFTGGDGFDTLVAGADGTRFITPTLAGIEAISGAGHADVILSGTDDDEVFDLSAIALTGVAAIAGRGGDDTVIGSAGGDTLQGMNGADVLGGGLGSDTIVGGRGVDRLTGGTDADLFVFGERHTGRSAAQADVILDFVSGEDRIDLSAIHAGTSDGAFVFVGTAAFGNAAGELRFEVVGGEALLLGDIDGDARADLTIRLSGVTALDLVDFVL